MPLYEYLCEKCGDVFELIQKFSDPELTVHEKCQGKVHRLISTSALQFKGSGWYVNDYPKESGRGPNSSSGSGPENGGSSSNESAKDSGKESSSSSSGSSESKASASTSAPVSSSSDKSS